MAVSGSCSFLLVVLLASKERPSSSVQSAPSDATSELGLSASALDISSSSNSGGASSHMRLGPESPWEANANAGAASSSGTLAKQVIIVPESPAPLALATAPPLATTINNSMHDDLITSRDLSSAMETVAQAQVPSETAGALHDQDMPDRQPDTAPEGSDGELDLLVLAAMTPEDARSLLDSQPLASSSKHALSLAAASSSAGSDQGRSFTAASSEDRASARAPTQEELLHAQLLFPVPAWDAPPRLPPYDEQSIAPTDRDNISLSPGQGLSDSSSSQEEELSVSVFDTVYGPMPPLKRRACGVKDVWY